MLEAAIAALYSGPLEEFIRQRDALAKQLRAAGDRTAAAEVKTLRKPSRLAWALNLGATSYPKVFAAFDAAVAELVGAQAQGADVRSAMLTLRETVRELARAAALVAERAGQRVEASALSTALLAVLGSPESLVRLRSGQLADVPEAGGLEFLAGLPAPPPPPARAPVSTGVSLKQDLAEVERARRAAEQLATAQARADAAAGALGDAEAELSLAEARLRDAEESLAAARQRRDAAHRQAELSAGELRAAQAAHAEARGRLQAAPRDRHAQES